MCHLSIWGMFFLLVHEVLLAGALHNPEGMYQSIFIQANVCYKGSLFVWYFINTNQAVLTVKLWFCTGRINWSLFCNPIINDKSLPGQTVASKGELLLFSISILRTFMSLVWLARKCTGCVQVNHCTLLVLSQVVLIPFCFLTGQ